MHYLLTFAFLFAVCGAPVPADVEAGPHTARGTGRAKFESFDFTFNFDAKGSPNQATGRIVIESEVDGGLTGSVDCLLVEGRRAVLSGTVDSQSFFPYFAVAVRDDPKERTRPRDRLAVTFQTEPISCTDANFLTGPTRIARGDIIVH